ncbi:DNA methyltransferase [Chitinophaga sp. MM2321]|uniref:DNA methyltransferase n=1 Tax=Chitinophaga sp. MM2321 TaxID=3137178 RepID=UPI0032D5A10D
MFDINKFLNINPNVDDLLNKGISHITEAYHDSIKAGKNSYAYDAHTYHTKVPPQGIEILIKYYTKENDVVLDPFCGSGMTGLAAIRQNRHVILSDLSPAAVFIAKNFTATYSVEAYKKAIDDILKQLASLEKELYTTQCAKCAQPTIQNYTVWSYGLICNECNEEFILWDVARDEKPSYKESKILSQFQCPNCHKVIKKGKLKRTKLNPVSIGYKCCEKGLKDTVHVPTAQDFKALQEINTIKINKWYPKNKFPSGVNTGQLINHGLDSIDKIYTHRALIALAEIWDSCINYKVAALRPLLMWTFTSLYQRVSVLSEFRFWGGSSNTANYNVPQIMNEQNVFKTFKRKANTIVLHLDEIKQHLSKKHISVGSATDLSHIPDNSIDYIFTDPPFGSNINYSEMNFLWESWLQVFTDNTKEAIVNKVQGKGVQDYKALMTTSFSEMHRVLKNDSWLTVVFHNSSGKVWDAIRNSLYDAGFFISDAHIFDKEHGTFKMFVSDNAVGYDLILHCQKNDLLVGHAVVEKSIEDFVREMMKKSDYVFSFIHVERNPETNFRKLYSEWIAHQIVSNNINISFDNFRNIVSKIIEHAKTENASCL